MQRVPGHAESVTAMLLKFRSRQLLKDGFESRVGGELLKCLTVSVMQRNQQRRSEQQLLPSYNVGVEVKRSKGTSNLRRRHSLEFWLRHRGRQKPLCNLHVTHPKRGVRSDVRQRQVRPLAEDRPEIVNELEELSRRRLTSRADPDGEHGREFRRFVPVQGRDCTMK